MASEKVYTRKVVSVKSASPSVAPTSPGVLIGDTLYLSGALGYDYAKGALVPGGISAQAEQALKNIGSILHAAGADYSNVVKTTVFLSDISNWPAMNVVYEKFFKRPYPARSAFAVKDLPMGALVEIEAVAVVGKIVDQEQLYRSKL